METIPDTEAMQMDKDSKAKMKAYVDHKRQVKPHNLYAGDITLVKQRRLNKPSTHFEPVPYTVLDVKGSLITARRATDQKEVIRNRNYQTHQEVPYLTSNQYPPMSKCHSTSKDRRSDNRPQPQHPQEESSQAQPSNNNGNQDNTTLAATEQSTLSPPVSPCSSLQW